MSGFGYNINGFGVGSVKNLEPVITSSPVTTGAQGVAYSYQVQATDPEGGSLTYTLPTNPSGMTISGSGLISWTPSSSGSESVVVRVTDNKGAFAEQSYSVAVEARVSLSFVVVAGGGSGAFSEAGGGGAGGLLDSTLSAQLATAYPILVGSGGTYEYSHYGNNGSNSVFATFTAIGGGGGGDYSHSNADGVGRDGGSGGGAGPYMNAGGSATSGQGNDGGDTPVSYAYGAGGGGAGAVGSDSSTSSPGAGGSGTTPSTAGTALGGGGSGGRGNSLPAVSGGSGGGGSGGSSRYNQGVYPTAGTANTGGGGGGGAGYYYSGNSAAYQTGYAGGSGVIYLKYPSSNTATFSAGVSQTTTTSGGYKTSKITAAGASDTVTFG